MYWSLLAICTVGARKSLQLALLLLPARWKQRVSGPVGLGMVPRSAGRTETMGNPSCSRQGLKPGRAGHGFIFCSRRSAKLKPWDSRLFPTGLGPPGETPRAKGMNARGGACKTDRSIMITCIRACLQLPPTRLNAGQIACGWLCSFCLHVQNKDKSNLVY